MVFSSSVVSAGAEVGLGFALATAGFRVAAGFGDEGLGGAGFAVEGFGLPAGDFGSGACAIRAAGTRSSRSSRIKNCILAQAASGDCRFSCS